MAEMSSFLIVGLGNPGAKYAHTRHNIGFQFLDYLEQQYSLRFSSSKWQADVIRTELWQKQVVLVKPETYMNKSGIAVGAIARYYRIQPANMIVIHDDIDLDVGRLKIVVGRGAGGHNGIRSIIEHMGDKNFSRIRVGVGRPELPIPVDRYVLSSFSKDEQVVMDEAMGDIAQGLELIVTEGANAAMNKVNAGG